MAPSAMNFRVVAPDWVWIRGCLSIVVFLSTTRLTPPHLMQCFVATVRRRHARRNDSEIMCTVVLSDRGSSVLPSRSVLRRRLLV